MFLDETILSCILQSPSDGPWWNEAPVANSGTIPGFLLFPNTSPKTQMLPGILYQKATCSQILGSEAQTKTVTKKQTWGHKSRHSDFSAHALSHHALLVLGSGLQRIINICLLFLYTVSQEISAETHRLLPLYLEEQGCC